MADRKWSLAREPPAGGSKASDTVRQLIDSSEDLVRQRGRHGAADELLVIRKLGAISPCLDERCCCVKWSAETGNRPDSETTVRVAGYGSDLWKTRCGDLNL